MTQPRTREERRAELSRMTKRSLAAMCRDGIRRPDGGLAFIEGAHPVERWDKDEIITSVLSVEYPAVGDPAAGGGAAGLTAPTASPQATWQAIRDRSADPELVAILAQMAATPAGRAALAASRRSWAAHGLEPPWPRIVPVALADVLPAGAAAIPEGTTASRCTACGEARLARPGDRGDEWRHHLGYCPVGEAW
jgi:hypothetical protein